MTGQDLKQKKLLVTGASGFVGSALVDWYLKKGVHLVQITSSRCSQIQPETEDIFAIEIGGRVDWDPLLEGVDSVIHLAAVTHQNNTNADNWPLFQSVNIDGTRCLLEACGRVGVKHFIFLSSVKVYGECSLENVLLDEMSVTGQNCDNYGISKLAAEQLVQKICDESAMTYTIIRSPLVYGPGVKANFRQLLALAKTGWPLPFKGLTSQRSMIGLDNLVSFIEQCSHDSRASNQIFTVCDDGFWSLAELLTRMREYMAVSPNLFYCPNRLLDLLFFLVGKREQYDKVARSFMLSNQKAKSLLGWQPEFTREQALKQTVLDYMNKK